MTEPDPTYCPASGSHHLFIPYVQDTEKIHDEFGGPMERTELKALICSMCLRVCQWQEWALFRYGFTLK